jgi:hypothetical protein
MSAKAKIGAAVVIAVGLSVAVWQGLGDRSQAPVPSIEGGAQSPPVAGAPPPEGGTEQPEEPAAARPPRPADVVAATSRISGRVVYDDGGPARGIYLTAYFNEHLIAAEYSYNVAVTDEDGRFSFPAVRGAPYRVGLLSDGLDGLVTWRKDLRRDARGGDPELAFTLPRVGTLLVGLVDAGSGEPVDAQSYYLRWTQDGKIRTGVGFPYAKLPELHRAPRPHGPDAAEVLLSKDRFRILLPPLDAVDRDSAVTLVVRCDAERYEPAVLVIPRADLGRDLGERRVPARRLPAPDGGWRLSVTARYEDGAPYSGEGKLRILRGEERVQELTFNVEDGEATVAGLALGADVAHVYLENTGRKVAPCPTRESEVRGVEYEFPRRWELVVDPHFHGEPRQLRVEVVTRRSSHGANTRSMTVRAGSWPKSVSGSDAGTATVTLTDEDGVVATAEVAVTPGESVTVRPVIPPKRR